MAIAVALALGLGYLSGALPWGLWLGRWVRGVDVRTLGSRNLGATNVYRSLGPGLGILTLLLDMAKGAVPVAVVPGMAASQAFPGGREWCMMAVGVAAVAGHMWTCSAWFWARSASSSPSAAPRVGDSGARRSFSAPCWRCW